MDITPISRYIALILRHHPEIIGITIAYEGAWAKTSELLAGVQRRFPQFDMAMLEHIVATDKKQRYSFSAGKSLIRANQGHSIPVNLGLKAQLPPPVLYHGTAEPAASAILLEGVKRMTRQYVHLSRDEKTAKTVGCRHGKPVLFAVDAARMHADGYAFYLSENNVWLTDAVPAQYLTLLNQETEAIP